MEQNITFRPIHVTRTHAHVWTGHIFCVFVFIYTSSFTWNFYRSEYFIASRTRNASTYNNELYIMIICYYILDMFRYDRAYKLPCIRYTECVFSLDDTVHSVGPFLPCENISSETNIVHYLDHNVMEHFVWIWCYELFCTVWSSIFHFSFWSCCFGMLTSYFIVYIGTSCCFQTTNCTNQLYICHTLVQCI